MRLAKFLLSAFLSHTKDSVVMSRDVRGRLRAFMPSPHFELTPSSIVEEIMLDKRIHSLQYIRSDMITDGIRSWIIPNAFAAEDSPLPPTQAEIKLLREAFATFYGVDRDLDKSEKLLSKVIEAWQRQPPDEQAGLYRVRGDCYMALLNPQSAESDYGRAIALIQGPGGDEADPDELPASLLGRARAIRSQGAKVQLEQAKQAAQDYQLAMRLSSREDWDTDAEREEDGASRNPYAAWEWAAMLRRAGNLEEAARVHTMASLAFDDIGDKARAILSSFDSGVDLAALGKNSEARSVIEKSIKKMKSIEGGNVELLQHLLAKEGEGRVALASVLWDSGERQDAETLFGTACYKFEQLEADAERRVSGNKQASFPTKLKFSIDDGPGAFDIGCSRFRNAEFLTEGLEWPPSMQKKVAKLQGLEK